MMAAHSAGEYRILRRYQGGEPGRCSGTNVKDVKPSCRRGKKNYRRTSLGDYGSPASTSGVGPGGCLGKKRKVVLPHAPYPSSTSRANHLPITC
jgi:hypothetical protein